MHPIRIAAEKSKLTSHVIRMWERRYKAVCPHRSVTGQRLYDDEQIKRLRLLQCAVASGHSIGQIANLSDPDLRELQTVSPIEISSAVSIPKTDTDFVDRCLISIRRLAADEFQAELQRTSLAYSHQQFITNCIEPLMQRIGLLWHSGDLSIAAEHLASVGIRSFVDNVRLALPVQEDAPLLLVATTVGQMHEIGALFVATMACVEGWRSNYLGRDIPAEAIVYAASELNALAVAISVVYAPDSNAVMDQVSLLRENLDPDVALIVGGAGMNQFKNKRQDLKAIQLRGLAQLRPMLAEIVSKSQSEEVVLR